MYTAVEAAEQLGVTRQTVARYVRTGLLEAEHVGLNKAIRIADETLLTFAESRGLFLKKKAQRPWQGPELQ